MKEHLTEEQLILHYYGEETDTALAGHLESCGTCRDAYRALQLVLNAVEQPVPERGPDYEAEVWTKLAPKITRRRWFGWLGAGKFAPAVAVAALLVAAFFMGRYTRPAAAPNAVASRAPVRERVLLVAVGDHLERSQMVLAEIENLPGAGKQDIGAERSLARNLVDSNRLFRQTAMKTGDTGVASVLDDLERVLVEIANSPDEISRPDLDRLQQRIKSDGLLFKIHVVGSHIRAQERLPLTARSRDTSL